MEVCYVETNHKIGFMFPRCYASGFDDKPFCVCAIAASDKSLDEYV